MSVLIQRSKLEDTKYPSHVHCWHNVQKKHFLVEWQVCCKCLKWKKKEAKE